MKKLTTILISALPATIAALAMLTLAACDKDDDGFKYTNSYTFDGATTPIEIFWAGYVEEGGYNFYVYADQDAIDEDDYLLRIDIPEELFGAEFRLTDDRVDGSWKWYVVFDDTAAGKLYEGVGEEDGMGDVASGTIYAAQLPETGYEMKFDVKFTDGKRLKGNYRGQTWSAE